jgi:outer membrane protein W
MDMRSTHQNHFRGASFIVSQVLKNNFSLGLGAEYAHSAFHGDNGYNLYNLTFIPFFIDVKYNFKTERKFKPYVTVEPGMSFAKYKRENQNSGNTRVKVTERGLFLYVGTGAKYQINKHFAPLIDFGFKGYKMSFNNLDINPHGIVMRAGVVIQ